MDVEAVQVTSLQVIFDLLVTFGLDAFAVDPNIDDDEEEEKAAEEEDGEKEEEEERSKKKTETACAIVSVLSRLLDSEVNTGDFCHKDTKGRVSDTSESTAGVV